MIDIVDSEQTYKQKLLGQRSNITLVEDINRVHYGDIPFIEPRYAKAGDILVTNGTDKFFVKPEIYKTIEDKVGKDIHPIGVCAIPAALTVNFGDQGVNKGKSRVVSLAYMSLKTPENGSLELNGVIGDNAMYWGEMGTHLSGFNAGKYGLAWIDLKTGVLTGSENSKIFSVYIPTTAKTEVLTNRHYVDRSDPKIPKYFFSEFDQLRDDAAAGFSPYGRYGKYYFKGYLGILMGKEITDTIISKVTAEWGGGN